MTVTTVTYCNSSAIHSNNTVVGVLSHAPTTDTNNCTANHNKNNIDGVGACESTPKKTDTNNCTTNHNKNNIDGVGACESTPKKTDTNNCTTTHNKNNIDGVGACESTPKKPFRITPLGTVVCCLKSAVTTYARKNNIIDFAWQPRYHDRIIRNMYEASRISDYIRDNVAKWNGKIECHETIINAISNNHVGVLSHAPTEQNMTQIS